MKEYPYIASLINDGFGVAFNDTGIGKSIVIVYDEGGQLIMFSRGRLTYEKMMAKLEAYAKDLVENGMSNDEITGVRVKIW
jgi:hypothetical protein